MVIYKSVFVLSLLSVQASAVFGALKRGVRGSI